MNNMEPVNEPPVDFQDELFRLRFPENEIPSLLRLRAYGGDDQEPIENHLAFNRTPVRSPRSTFPVPLDISDNSDPEAPLKQFRSDTCLWLEYPLGLSSSRQPLGRFSSPPVLSLTDGFTFSTGFELLPCVPKDPFLGYTYCSNDEIGFTFGDNCAVGSSRSASLESTPAMRIQTLRMFHPRNDTNIYLYVEWSEFFKDEDYRNYRDMYLSAKVQAISKAGGDQHLVNLGTMSAPLESGAAECGKCCHKVFTASGILCKVSHFLDSDLTQTQTYLERYSDDSRDQNPKYSVLLECKLTFSILKSPYKSLDKKLEALSTETAKDCGRKMLKNPAYSDFTLICEDKSYPVHRNILAPHSDVFSAMFESKMKEDHSQQLVLEDMTPSGVESLLGFLYSGDISGPKSSSMLAVELLRTGEKYMIHPLKNICKEILLNSDISKIPLHDAFAMFELGTMIKDCSALQSVAIKAFVKNSEEYANEVNDLATLFTANPTVAALLMCKVVLNFSIFV